MRTPELSTVAALTAALVETPSPNPGGDERAVASLVTDALAERGLPRPRTVAREPHRPNLVVELDFGPGGRHLCLSGHLDTKPVGDAAWSVPPLRATLDGDRMYGLGSADMKGAVAAMIEAAALLAADPPPRGRLTLLFTADEENGAAYGARHLAEHERAAAGLGDIDAVVIGEPGGLDADWDRLHLVSRGIARFRFVTEGDQGHSSLVERTGAVNAAVTAARLLTRFADHFQPTIPADPTLTATDLAGRPSGTTAGRPGAADRGGLDGWRATANGGMKLYGGIGYGVVPGRAGFDAEVRLLPGMSRETFERELDAFLAASAAADPELRAEVSFDDPPVDWLPGTAVPADHPVAAAARRAYAAVFGAAPPDAVFPGTTDAAWLHGLAGVPTLPAVGPGLLSRCHGADEWVSVTAVENAVELYRRLANDFCTAQGGEGA